jgi:hypothetical protein
MVLPKRVQRKIIPSAMMSAWWAVPLKSARLALPRLARGEAPDAEGGALGTGGDA